MHTFLVSFIWAIYWLHWTVSYFTILTLVDDLYKWEVPWDVHRWADKFCLHCNIFIYIRHIWIKPVLCSRMVSLIHHTPPWTHKCLEFSPSAHRNGRVFRHSVQTTCCYWILNRGKSSFNEIHRWMQAVCGDQCVDVSTVRHWVEWSLQRGNGLKNKIPIFIRTDFKN